MSIRPFNRAATIADLDPAGWHPAVRAAAEWVLRGQHPCRGWEYSQALAAYDQYAGPRASILDVGGAGSLAYRLFMRDTTDHLSHITRVDPALPTPTGQLRYQDADRSFVCAETLEEYIGGHPPPYRVVLCLSVLEHVPAAKVPDFLTQLASCVAPGGLLVLTFDFGQVEKAGAGDPYHFHWMRGGWIPTAESLRLFYQQIFKPAGLQCVTPERNYLWPDPTPVYDYTVASLVLQRSR